MEARSASQPFAATPSQSPKPASQRAIWHKPAAQLGVPWATVQTFPQAPQWFTSLAGATLAAVAGEAVAVAEARVAGSHRTHAGRTDRRRMRRCTALTTSAAVVHIARRGDLAAVDLRAVAIAPSVGTRAAVTRPVRAGSRRVGEGTHRPAGAAVAVVVGERDLAAIGLGAVAVCASHRAHRRGAASAHAGAALGAHDATRAAVVGVAGDLALASVGRVAVAVATTRVAGRCTHARRADRRRVRSPSTHDATGAAVIGSGERGLAAVARVGIAVAQALAAARRGTHAADTARRRARDDAGRAVGGSGVGAGAVVGVAHAHHVAHVAGAAEDAEALAGVALAVAVGIKLRGIGHRAAVVVPVEDAVAVDVHRRAVDAKLDAQPSAVDERGVVLPVDAAKLAFVAHDVEIGVAEFALATTGSRDKHPDPVASGVVEALALRVPAGDEVPLRVGVAVVVVGVAGVSREVHAHPLAPRPGGARKRREGTHRYAARADLVDAHRRVRRRDEVAELRRPRHHRRQEHHPARPPVVQFIHDDGLRCAPDGCAVVGAARRREHPGKHPPDRPFHGSPLLPRCGRSRARRRPQHATRHARPRRPGAHPRRRGAAPTQRTAGHLLRRRNAHG
jgi:hypothetical protein